jgi:hypothetical protein
VTAPASPAAGDVLQLAENDYRFGRGTLTMRVTEVLHLQQLPDGLWVSVRGVTLLRTGQEGPERQVLVRVSALGRALRRRDS